MEDGVTVVGRPSVVGVGPEPTYEPQQETWRPKANDQGPTTRQRRLRPPPHLFGLLMRRPPGPPPRFLIGNLPLFNRRSVGDLHPLGPRIRRHLLLSRRLDGCLFSEPSQPHRVGPGLAVAEFCQRQSDPEQPLVSGRGPADQRRFGMAAAAPPVPARISSRTYGLVRAHHEPLTPKRCWPPGRTAKSATSIRK